MSQRFEHFTLSFIFVLLNKVYSLKTHSNLKSVNLLYL